MKIIAMICVVLSAFVAGIVFQILRPLPYDYLAKLTHPNIRSPGRDARADEPQVRSVQEVDTALLPLLKNTVVVPKSVGITDGAGGGITAVDERIIIVDLRGAFFSVEAKGARIRKLELPAISNHSTEYGQFGPRPETIRGFDVNIGFRVHDVESQKRAGGIRLFVSYERFLPALKTTVLAVSAIMVNEKDFSPLGQWEDIYEGQPLGAEWYSGIASGARMFASGENLYLTVGDYNQDNVFMASRFEAQNPDNDYGKVLSINLRAKSKTHVSIGHRNPQGLTITSQGRIFTTEHGPRGGDALNQIVQGRNFGWPVTTFGTHYTTYDWPNRRNDTRDHNFDKPNFVWVPSIGASNLIEVANFHPAWNNDLLVESLKAQSLYRLRQDADGHVLYSEPIPMGERLRDIASLSDGTLVLWTDQAHLIFLTVDAAKLAANKRPAPG